MIDRLTRSVAAAFPELRGEQLMDALWLAARYPTTTAPSLPDTDPAGTDPASPETEDVDPLDNVQDTTPPGTDLALPDDEPAIPQTVPVTEVGLRVPVATGPMPTTVTALSQFRRVHRPGPPVVDVDATVEATADAKRLVVVTRPSRMRGLDVALVVDHTPVATVWADTIAELQATLRRTGAFRSVTRWSLDESGDDLVLRDSAGTVHNTDFIIDPAGRRLVLLLTDGAAARWYAARVWRMLGRWAHVMPTNLVHLLPRTYWGYTATGQPTATVRSRRPANPNSGSEVMTSWWSDDPARTDVPVPIIAMRQEDIVRWTRAVVTGSSWTDAVWARPPEHTVVPQVELTPADRVHVFQTRASAGALELARVLASAPLLSLPLIRVLHEHLVRDAETEHLAELLVSGLLEKSPTGDSPDLRLRFRHGVAELLYQGTTTSQEWDVYEVLTEHLERNASTGDTVRAVVADPHGTATVAGDLVPFAAMSQRVATRLGITMPEEQLQLDETPQPVAPEPVGMTGLPVLGTSGIVCVPNFSSKGSAQRRAEVWVPAMLQGLRTARELDSAETLEERGVSVVWYGDLFGSIDQYFVDPQARQAAWGRIESAITDETRVIVAYAFGAVVAFEALRANPDWPVETLVTVGSPLGNPSIFRRLELTRQRGRWPGNIRRWTDIVYRGDTVAADHDLRDLFGSEVQAHVIDHGDGPHNARSYLASPVTGTAIATALQLAAIEKAAADVPETAGGRRYLLSCVIDYPDESLPRGVREASDMIDFFQSLGYRHVPLAPGRQDKARILTALRQFVEGQDRRADDVVMVYLSGHAVVERKQYFFVTADMNTNESGAISVDDLRDALFGASIIRRYLVVVDTEAAGQIADLVTGPGVKHSSRRTVVVIASDRPAGRARETGFTPAFTRAVREFNDGMVSTPELVRRIRSQTRPEQSIMWAETVGATSLPPVFFSPVRATGHTDIARRTVDGISAWLADTAERRPLIVIGEPGPGRNAAFTYLDNFSYTTVAAARQSISEITVQLRRAVQWHERTAVIIDVDHALDPRGLLKVLRQMIEMGDPLRLLLVTGRHLVPQIDPYGKALIIDLDEHNEFRTTHDELSLSAHHTLCAVDIAAFSRRSIANQAALHSGMYEAVQQAFGVSGILWDDCVIQDVGDGIFLAVPPIVPKETFANDLPRELSEALRTHNDTHPPEEQIKLRLALHAGEVTFHDRGFTSDAVVHVSRLLDAQPLKEALSMSQSPLAMIVSDWFYQEVIRHHPQTDPAIYQRVEVAVKETRAVGWIRLLSLTAPLIASPGFYELVDALEQLPSMRSEHTRSLVIEQLRFGGTIPYFPNRRAHITSILRTCLDFEGGIDELMLAIMDHEPSDSRPLARTLGLLTSNE